MLAFMSFSSAGLGQNEPLETTEEKGRMWGSGGWEGDLKSQHCFRDSYLFKLLGSGLISISIVPWGRQMSTESQLRHQLAEAPIGLMEPPQGGPDTEDLPQSFLFAAWLVGKDIKQRPFGCEDTFLAGECSTNLKVLC